MSTPNRHIPYVPEGTLDPAAGLNLSLDVIDAIFVPLVISMSLTEPPMSPADGDLYVPASPATGAWEGLEDYVVRFRSEGAFWQSYPPDDVGLLLNREDAGLYRLDGSDSWVLAAGLGDAPNDGEYYARRNEAWEPFTPGGGGSAFAPVVTEAGANLDADENNSGNYTRFTHASPTYTFDDAESFVTNAEYHGRYVGSGTLTITAAGGMTINAPAGGTLVIPPQGVFTVKIVAADEADLFGVTVPP